VPEIQRVVLLRHGRITAAGATADVLTAARLTHLFESPVAIEQEEGYYYARPGT
jgi:ABC-type hemin transport system ATPase subunit